MTETATYSVYQARTRFSELLRRVRSGERIIVSLHGSPVAEIRPVDQGAETLDQRILRLERSGRLTRSQGPAPPKAGLRKIARRPGGLERFLEDRG